MDIERNKLKELYSIGSKHSNYQILSEKLSKILNNNEIIIKSRYEKERMKFILDNINIANKSILDIGGNTGFFTFELIDKGAQRLHYYEGNNMHAEFVKLASKVLNQEKEINIINEYFKFEEEGYKTKYDMILLLNILHHIGDDYGNSKISITKAKQMILKQVNGLSKITDIIVFQLGFNWKGDKNLSLFENGTKEEMITFIENGTKKNWKILKIGVPEFINEKIEYRNLNVKNMSRIDSLGEFLNRPIFIMQSLR